ncbi:MAG: iron-sulfur cluster assembly accessory protein [Methylomonas sp.]|jgi:iron-sulfur cluster assembly protein
MSISITENAARQIEKQLQKRGNGVGLKLGVKESGCSGYAYVLDYANDIAEDDVIFTAHNVKVLVKPGDLDKLSGIELDYCKEGLNEAFKFNNPNVTGSCGCGKSFAL